MKTSIALRKIQQRDDAFLLTDTEKQAEVLAEVNLELGKLDREHTLKIRGLDDTNRDLSYALDLLESAFTNESDFQEQTQTHAAQMARYLELTRKGMEATHAFAIASQEAFNDSENRKLQTRINALIELKRVLREAEAAQTLAKGNAEIAQTYAPDDPQRARSTAIFGEAQRLLGLMKEGKIKYGYELNNQLEAFTKTYDTQHASDQTTRLAEAFWELDKAQKSLGNVGSPIAQEKWDVTGGMNKNWSDEDKKKYLDDKLGTKRIENSASAIADLIGQQRDLEAQIAESVAGRAGSLNALQQQEVKWQAEDKAALALYGERSQAEVAAIEAKRDAVRVLMSTMIENSKVQDQVDSLQNLWIDAFGNIQSKGLQSFGDLFSGILNQFTQMADKVLANQIWNGLGLGNLFGNLAGSILGGGSGGIAGIKGIGPVASGDAYGAMMNGSHENGLESVPYSGYKATLHQSERILTKEENLALPGMMADARRMSEQSTAMIRGVLVASQLSALSTQAHIAAQTGSLNGRGTAPTSGGDSPIHINGPIHIHGVRDAAAVPAALHGAVLSHREATRKARGTLNYGYEDD